MCVISFQSPLMLSARIAMGVSHMVSILGSQSPIPSALSLLNHGVHSYPAYCRVKPMIQYKTLIKAPFRRITTHMLSFIYLIIFSNFLISFSDRGLLLTWALLNISSSLLVLTLTTKFEKIVIQNFVTISKLFGKIKTTKLRSRKCATRAPLEIFETYEKVALRSNAMIARGRVSSLFFLPNINLKTTKL